MGKIEVKKGVKYIQKGHNKKKTNCFVMSKYWHFWGREKCNLTFVGGGGDNNVSPKDKISPFIYIEPK